MTSFLKILKLEKDIYQAMNGEDPLYWEGDMKKGTWKACVDAT